jgi:hypothetical protein
MLGTALREYVLSVHVVHRLVVLLAELCHCKPLDCSQYVCIQKLKRGLQTPKPRGPAPLQLGRRPRSEAFVTFFFCGQRVPWHAGNGIPWILTPGPMPCLPGWVWRPHCGDTCHLKHAIYLHVLMRQSCLDMLQQSHIIPAPASRPEASSWT